MRRSLTIIEVVAAVVILSVALVPMVSAMTNVAQGTARPIPAEVAAYLAAERMEEMVAARHRPSAGYAYISTANFPDEPSVSSYSGFARTVTVTEVANDLTTAQSGSGIKKVVVKVTWSANREIRFTRLFTDY